MDLRINFIILLTSTLAYGFLFKRRGRPLAIDGGWSSWQSWTSCYLNHANQSDFFPDFNGFQVRSRQRNCDSPRPVQGGRPCPGPARKYRQCGCSNSLGMESRKIADSQISSNADVYQDFNVAKGRLGNNAGWCSSDPISPFLNVYYQIDFESLTKVTAIATEGISLGRVTRFKLMYSLDGKQWILYKDKYRQNSEFIGNILPNKVKLNELDEPFTARFVKILPLHSYDRVCMKLELYGCIFTCGSQKSSSSGEIIARSAEAHDQKCLWRIGVKNTTNLSLDFLTFYIPCDQGFLEIRDGSQSYLKSKLLKRECGDDLATSLYKAPSNSLWVHFFSNSSSDEVGFRLRYISECMKNIRIVGTETLRITTPNYPKDYFDNNDCTWNVSSHSRTIHIWFNAFDVEASRLDGKHDCVNDFVSIEGIIGDKTSEISKFCNSHKPPVQNEPIIIRTEKIRIRFKSDDAITGKGFLLEITSYDKRKGKPTISTLPTEKKTTVWMKKEPVISSNLPAEPSQMFSPKMLISGPELNQSNLNSERNRTGADGLGYPVKEKSKKETDWTIFTVAAFSCFVFILIVFVTVISIRKCTSRYSGESGKFLPAISKKSAIDESYKPTVILSKNQKLIPTATVDEQLLDMKSPAGSIAVANSDSGSDLGEGVPLTADIVNHTLNRPKRKSFIDMYTDGSDELERTFEVSADLISPEISPNVEETTI